jgi:hypothetical protein
MKLGTQVRKVVPDIEGTVVGARWNEADGKLQVRVACDLDGMPHERWFDADELEVTATPEG